MNNWKIRDFEKYTITKIRALENFFKYVINKKRIQKKMGIVFICLYGLVFILKLPIIESFFHKTISPIGKIALENIEVARSKLKIPEFLFFSFIFVNVWLNSINYKKKSDYINFIIILVMVAIALSHAGFLISNPYDVQNILTLIIILIILDVLCGIKNLKFEKMKSNIFSSRENKLFYLEQLINSNKKNLILIDGIWGIGKTYFVQRAVENQFEYNYLINVDVLLFNDRNHMIEYTLNEINNILIKEGIRTNALRKYEKLIKSVSDKMPINLDGLLNPLSVEEIEKNIENHLNQLNKRIFIIVDNVERIIEETKKIDILGFLHKIYDLQDEKINIIVLADSSKLIGKNITKEYLEKFFINRIELKSLDKYEILDAFLSDKKVTTKQFEYIEAVYKELDEKIEDLQNREKNTEFLNRVLKEWENVNKYLETPRNIEHIIARIDEKSSQDKRIISKKYNFDEVEYLKTIILVEVYRSVINENAFSLTSENLLKGYSKASSKNEADFYNYFLTITFFWKKLNELSLGDKHYEMKARTIIKLIHNFENSEEEQIIKRVEFLSIEKLAKHATNIDDYISDFIKYAEYLDSKEISATIYKNILWYAMSFLKDKSLVLNPIIFELDRENSRSEKSILEIVNFNISDKDRVEELLLESYREDFVHYLRIKHDYIEKIDDIKQSLESIYNKDKVVFNSIFDLIREITVNETDKKYEYLINEFNLLLVKFDSIAYENHYNVDVPFSEIINQHNQWEISWQNLEKDGTLENFRKELDERKKTSNLIYKNLNEFWKTVDTNISIIDIKKSKRELTQLIEKMDKRFYEDIKSFDNLSKHDSALQELSDDKNYLKILDSELVYKLINKEPIIRNSLIDKTKELFGKSNDLFYTLKSMNTEEFDEEIIDEFNKLYEDFKEENFYFQVAGLNVVFKELKKELNEELKEELKNIIDEKLFNKIKISLIELMDSNRMAEVNEYYLAE